MASLVNPAIVNPAIVNPAVVNPAVVNLQCGNCKLTIPATIGNCRSVNRQSAVVSRQSSIAPYGLVSR
jgi:hypothetical protein